MKRMFRILVISVFILFTSASIKETKAQWWSASVSFQLFYDDLSPYGDWIYYPDHGYVWSPEDRYGFQPYRTGGHWVWTDEYGWLWVSDYDWGWAPFHYGRWFHDPYRGWLWVPDYEWAPAWVVWRSGADYYGWAPLQPGISISLSFGSPVAYNYWSFVPSRYIVHPNLSPYYVNVQQNVTIINKTKVITNYRQQNKAFVTGPSRSDAERYAKIQPVKLREAGKAGRTTVSKNEVSVFKPNVSKSRSTNEKPKSYQAYKQDKTVSPGKDKTVTPGKTTVPGKKANDANRVKEPTQKQQPKTVDPAQKQRQQDAIRKQEQDKQRKQQEAAQKVQQDKQRQQEQMKTQQQPKTSPVNKGTQPTQPPKQSQPAPKQGGGGKKGKG
jgi:hypothetical protein